MSVGELILGQDLVFGHTPISNAVKREWEIEKQRHPSKAPNGHHEDIYIATIAGHHQWGHFMKMAHELGLDTKSQQDKDLQEYLNQPAGTWAKIRQDVADGFMLPTPPPVSGFPYWQIKEVERAELLLDDLINLIEWGDGLELRDGEEEEIVVFSAFIPEFLDLLVTMHLDFVRAKPFAEISLPYLHFTAPPGTWACLEHMVQIGGCVWWEDC